MTFQSRLSAVAIEMETVLDALLPPISGPSVSGPQSASAPQSVVAEAMRYGALGGGKRLRPFLLIESARLFGVQTRGIWQAAAALECLHVYSLIHDDLPCMDDDDMRRGKPTVHKVYGEAMAVLAGDGLLTHAMALIAGEAVHTDAVLTLSLVRALAKAGGVSGMIGGQVMDITADAVSDTTADSHRSEGFITELQQLKTGALISFACTAGATLADARPDDVENLRAYARDLGLAFQIKDDILDVEGDAALIGKAVGKDAGLGKVTFVTILGLEGAREKAAELGMAAKGRLASYGKKADTLCDTVDFVLERTH